MSYLTITVNLTAAVGTGCCSSRSAIAGIAFAVWITCSNEASFKTRTRIHGERYYLPCAPMTVSAYPHFGR
jgi:hypothetical protein